MIAGVISMCAVRIGRLKQGLLKEDRFLARPGTAQMYVWDPGARRRGWDYRGLSGLIYVPRLRETFRVSPAGTAENSPGRQSWVYFPAGTAENSEGESLRHLLFLHRLR
jgi:hypothetical protein